MTIEDLEKKRLECMAQYDREYDAVVEEYRKRGIRICGLDGGNAIPELVEAQKRYFECMDEIVHQAKELKAKEDRQQ